MDRKYMYSVYNVQIQGDRNRVFICNSKKGTYEFVGTDIFNKIKGNNFDLPQELFDKLLQKGIIEACDSNVYSVIDNGEVKKITPTAFILPTYDCNLHCEYCFQLNGTKNSENNQLDTLEWAVRIIKEKRYYENPIYLFGGEPILEKNRIFLEKFIDTIMQNNWKYAIFTNGTNIQKFIELFKKSQSFCDHIHITIDGGEETHNSRRGNGTYKEIKKNIIMLLDMGICVKIRVNVDSITVASLENLLCDYEELCQTGLLNIYCAAIRESIDNLKVDSENFMLNSTRQKLLDLKQKYNFTLKNFLGLEFGNSVKKGELLERRDMFCSPKVMFDPMGTCYPCISAASFPDLAININEDEFSWWLSKRAQNKNECKVCQYFNFCGGGCSLEWKQNNVYRCKDFIDENLRFSLNYYLSTDEF